MSCTGTGLATPKLGEADGQDDGLADRTNQSAARPAKVSMFGPSESDSTGYRPIERLVVAASLDVPGSDSENIELGA